MRWKKIGEKEKKKRSLEIWVSRKKLDEQNKVKGGDGHDDDDNDDDDDDDDDNYEDIQKRRK